MQGRRKCFTLYLHQILDFHQIYHSKTQLVSILILSRSYHITGVSKTNQIFETTRTSHNGVVDEYLMDAH